MVETGHEESAEAHGKSSLTESCHRGSERNWATPNSTEQPKMNCQKAPMPKAVTQPCDRYGRSHKQSYANRKKTASAKPSDAPLDDLQSDNASLCPDRVVIIYRNLAAGWPHRLLSCDGSGLHCCDMTHTEIGDNPLYFHVITDCRKEVRSNL